MGSPLTGPHGPGVTGLHPDSTFGAHAAALLCFPEASWVQLDPHVVFQLKSFLCISGQRGSDTRCSLALFSFPRVRGCSRTHMYVSWKTQLSRIFFVYFKRDSSMNVWDLLALRSQVLASCSQASCSSGWCTPPSSWMLCPHHVPCALRCPARMGPCPALWHAQNLSGKSLSWGNSRRLKSPVALRGRGWHSPLLWSVHLCLGAHTSHTNCCSRGGDSRIFLT